MNESITKHTLTAAASWRGGRTRGAADILCCAALCSVLVSGTLAADTIVKVSGATIDDVTIVAAQWDLVRYQLARSSRSQSIPGDQVASIERDPTHPNLRDGRREFEAGDYEKAVEKLSQLTGAPNTWEAAEGAFLLARAYAEMGDAEKAEGHLKTYLAAHEKEKDWWVPHAIYELGTVLIERQLFESAEEHFKKLEEMPGQWTLRAQVGRARAIESGKQSAEYLKARQLLLGVAKGRETPLELRHEAYVVRSRIFLRQKQYDAAVKELTDVFFDPSKAREYRYDARRAEATYLMGRAFLKLGGKENLEQAELWLLRVPALYPNRGRIYDQSCLALAVVYNELGNRTRALEWRQRAKDAQEEKDE